MILGFKTQINNKPTHFVQKILACIMPDLAEKYKPKKHTIREGNRWKAGMKIHMATGVRTKAYNQFNYGYPINRVVSVQSVQILHSTDGSKTIMIDGNCFAETEGRYRNGYNLEGLLRLAQNDGFETIEDFFAYFDKYFEGQIIHWTDLKY